MQYDKSIDRLRTQLSPIFIAASRLFLLPCYYPDMCPCYNYYHSKLGLYSVVPVTTLLAQITAVLSLLPLPCCCGLYVGLTVYGFLYMVFCNQPSVLHCF